MERATQRVYLGDAGSYLLGTALAMLFVSVAQYPAAEVSSALLFVGVPVADTTVAIIRRLRAHTPLFRGDRGHVYDQLVDRGWSAKLAVVACVGAQAVLTGVGIGVANLTGGVAVSVAVLSVAIVGGAAILTFAPAPGPLITEPTTAGTAVIGTAVIGTDGHRDRGHFVGVRGAGGTIPSATSREAIGLPM